VGIKPSLATSSKNQANMVPNAHRFSKRLPATRFNSIVGQAHEKDMMYCRALSAAEATTTTAGFLATTTSAPMAEVGLMPPESAADKCAMDSDISCGALQSAAAIMYGDIKDSVAKLEHQLEDQDAIHAAALKAIDDQIDAVSSAKWEADEQLARATSSMNEAEQQRAEKRKEEADLAKKHERDAQGMHRRIGRQTQELVCCETATMVPSQYSKPTFWDRRC